MILPITADGSGRVVRNPAMQARLRELTESIQTSHAAELAKAGFFRRILLRWRMAAEYRKEKRRMLPSPQSLYSSRIA